MQNEVFYEFEIRGEFIPNLIGFAFFCGVVIFFEQARKAKARLGEKAPPHQ